MFDLELLCFAVCFWTLFGTLCAFGKVLDKQKSSYQFTYVNYVFIRTHKFAFTATAYKTLSIYYK